MKAVFAVFAGAVLAGALVVLPVAARAQASLECTDALGMNKLSVELDFDRETVAGAFPINWVWFTPAFVLFQYGATINGDRHVLQTYSLDRATSQLEVCDFAGGEQQACVVRRCETQRTLWASRASRTMVTSDRRAAAKISISAPIVP
jgi:hypothetical protein